MRRFPQVFAKFVATITFSFGGLTLLFLPTAAQNKFNKEANRSSEAAVTLESVTALTEAAALKEFIGQAAAIGVFPAISQQTALFLEQATGDGVLSVRTSNGWTTPAFYSLGSVRYRGIFIKGGKFAVIVLFIRKDLLLTCGKENVRLEAGKNTRPGVVGTLSDTQQSEFKDAVIIAYSFSKGRLLPHRRSGKTGMNLL